ncbi:TadE/TadG family type IV pilus assembly protein [Ferrimonas balearica]|uniref:TadE/TadG family type IV pilus assembly protein n=1 Tax=Ferrimonas balearica TaxID=44012 RepID=UPI001C58DCBD|nr:TadE/TadG family type IV pilus assembly protein [Ferrimonas balearica]MBW3162964.1 pilus assembly protein [Ferrimonas balearica]
MKRHQQGAYVVEFAIVATVVFVMLFACLEVARLMYSYNALTEVSRRAARLAAVCAPSPGTMEPTDAMKALALFDGRQLVANLDADNIVVDYLTNTGALAASIPDTTQVRATVANYQHELIIPGFFIQLNSPAFRTLMPSESLGQTRYADSNTAETIDGVTYCSSTGG